jgi:hypothetical protein
VCVREFHEWPRKRWAELHGRAYTPGGAAEIDEMFDLLAIWHEDDHPEPKPTEEWDDDA